MFSHVFIGGPFNSETHHPGNGQMTAFLAERRAVVDATYQSALANGGSREGQPGLRPGYRENYHGA